MEVLPRPRTTASRFRVVARQIFIIRSQVTAVVRPYPSRPHESPRYVNPITKYFRAGRLRSSGFWYRRRLFVPLQRPTRRFCVRCSFSLHDGCLELHFCTERSRDRSRSPPGFTTSPVFISVRPLEVNGFPIIASFVTLKSFSNNLRNVGHVLQSTGGERLSGHCLFYHDLPLRNTRNGRAST